TNLLRGTKQSVISTKPRNSIARSVRIHCVIWEIESNTLQGCGKFFQVGNSSKLVVKKHPEFFGCS
ncbi:hypothetical protein, partial [Gimesia sp.]|uniref:hypothetical protein n=1 Tax=Gimesia sp. TaxID=2024833 RepID=UPI003A8DAB5B